MIELVGEDLVPVRDLVAEHVLEPAAVLHGLADEVEQVVDLLGRHANRSAPGERGCSDGLQSFAGGVIRRGLRQEPAPTLLELVEQIGRPFAVARQLSAHRVHRSEQGLHELERKVAVFAHPVEQILDRMRERADVLEPEHAAPPLIVCASRKSELTVSGPDRPDSSASSASIMLSSRSFASSLNRSRNSAG